MKIILKRPYLEVKVLLVSHCFPPAQDGGSVTFGYLKEIILKAGHSVEVVSSNCYSSDDFVNKNSKAILPGQEKKENLLINRLAVFKGGRRVFRLLEKILGKGIWSLFAKGPVFADPGMLFKKRRVDWVVSGFFPTLAPFWGYLLAKRNKARFALVPGFHLDDPSYQNHYLFKLLQKADLIFCFTKWEKKYYQELGINGEKIKAIGNVAPGNLLKSYLKKPAPFPKNPVVLYLGAKAAHKRIDFLIEAMEIVWRKSKRARLVIAGPETLYSPKIIKKIQKLKPAFKKQVKYYSRVSEKKKISLLDKATVLVNPALAESFSLVIMDGWSRKKPVIATNLPVKRELIANNIDGLLFKKDSVEDLADKIIKIISSPKTARRMGECGYNKVINKYTMGKIGSKLLKALKDK